MGIVIHGPEFAARYYLPPTKTFLGIRSHKFVFDVPAAAVHYYSVYLVIRSLDSAYGNACRLQECLPDDKKNRLNIYTKKTSEVKKK